MDIHKPKAAHSIREFLVEIGTIICGILIALGLEQSIEALHRNTEVRETREVLNTEMSENIARLVLSTQENRCLLPQLATYAAWARGGSKPPPFRYFMPLLRTSTWDTVKSGAVAHMPLKDRVSLAAHYDAINNHVQTYSQQLTFHWPLIAFAELASLGADQKVALLKVVAQEQLQAHRIIGTANYTIERTRADMKLPEATSRGLARTRAGVAWVCNPTAPDPFGNAR